MEWLRYLAEEGISSQEHSTIKIAQQFFRRNFVLRAPGVSNPLATSRGILTRLCYKQGVVCETTVPQKHMNIRIAKKGAK